MNPRRLDIKKIVIWTSVPIISWSLVAFLCVQACSQSSASSEKPKTDTQIEKQPFSLPSIPSELNTPEERADYLALHYWDHYNFQDTARIGLPEETEQILSDYIAIFPHLSDSMLQASIFELLSQAEKEKNMFSFFTELLEKYLYDPNSPFRDEEYYLHVLRFIEASSTLDEIQKTRFAYQLNLVLKNRKGTKAVDFTYTLPNGSQNRMYAIKSDYLILYFNDPDCHTCQEEQINIENSQIVSEAIRDGRLKVLAIYPDEDLQAWKANLSHMPASWINGYDSSRSIKQELYALRAIPSLYLLSGNKTVLIKDGTLKQVEILLENDKVSI